MLVTIFVITEDGSNTNLAKNACCVHIILCDENGCKTNSVFNFNFAKPLINAAARAGESTRLKYSSTGI